MPFHSENIFAFKHRGSPLYCPHCDKEVDLSREDYKNHLEETPSTCLDCNKSWKLENNMWV